MLARDVENIDGILKLKASHNDQILLFCCSQVGVFPGVQKSDLLGTFQTLTDSAQTVCQGLYLMVNRLKVPLLNEEAVMCLPQ